MKKKSMSQSPQTGQVYFNSCFFRILQIRGLGTEVSIPSNGSSLFQLSTPVIVTENSMKMSLNPLKRVKFISIQTNPKSDINSIMCLNPLKRVKFISMELTGKFPEEIENYWSQSPQTGQVYFNLDGIKDINKLLCESQSPQTGQVYFNLS